MENELICTPVMLPMKETYGYFDIPVIWYSEGYKMQLKDKFLSNLDMTCGYKPQHLYLTSSREIKEGDWYYNPIVGTIHKSVGGRYDKMFKKVEAATNIASGLPLIPQSFVEQWVSKQGKIDQVKLSVAENGNLWLTGNPYNTPSGEVLILPIKDSWNREELKIACFKTWELFTTASGFIDFNEWFDKNY